MIKYIINKICVYNYYSYKKTKNRFNNKSFSFSIFKKPNSI